VIQQLNMYQYSFTCRNSVREHASRPQTICWGHRTLRPSGTRLTSTRLGERSNTSLRLRWQAPSDVLDYPVTVVDGNGACGASSEAAVRVNHRGINTESTQRIAWWNTQLPYRPYRPATLPPTAVCTTANVA